MKIVIASDHRGFALKSILKKFLEGMKTAALDVGTFSSDPVDYPDFGAAAAEKVSRGEYERGIVICGSGIGMGVVANKFPGVRAAVCKDIYSAKMSRAHNNSNILSLGADQVSEDLAREIVQVWLQTDFEGGRHQRRLEKIRNIESRCRTNEGEHYKG